MRAAPPPRRLAAPPGTDLVPARSAGLAARAGAVTSIDQGPVAAYLTGGGASISGVANRRFDEAYGDWQTDAKTAARTVGVARFTANMFALTAQRVRLTVEETFDGVEWDETEDDRAVGIMSEYRNATLNQGPSELMRLHAWHYQVGGEGMIANRDSQALRGAEWLLLSTRAVELDKPQKGAATVRLAPNGSVQNTQAFVVQRGQIFRYWMPDEEYALLPISPMTAAMDDLRRWQDLTRYARRVALNYLAMNGLLWIPKVALETEEAETDAAIEQAIDVAPEAKRHPVVELYQSVGSTSIANDERMESVIAPLFWWGAAGDQPVWTQIGNGLDEEGIAHRAEALADWARGVDAPAALVAGGGTDLASSHWGAWLTEERFHGSVAPLLDRMTHSDLTVAYLAPMLRFRGLQEGDVQRFRVGYDATDVIIHPDKSDLALRAYLAGLLRDTVALREMGWNPDTDLADEASLQRLAFVLTRGMSSLPVTVGETPPAGPTEITGPVPDGNTGPGDTIEGPPPSGPAAPGQQAAIGDLVDQVLGPYAPPGWTTPLQDPRVVTHAVAQTTPYLGSTLPAGTTITLTAERTDSHGSPPSGAEAAADAPGSLVPLDQVTTPVGAAPRMARVHPRTEAQKTVGAQMRAYRKLVRRLAAIRRDTGRKILAGAEVAFAEALRLAGIRAVSKARGKSRTTATAIDTAWRNREGIGSHLAALGLTEAQLLNRAFDSYEDQVRAWLQARTVAERQAIEDAGFDPELVQTDDSMVDEAAIFLGAALLALARQRILDGSDPVTLAGPGEVSGQIPAQYAAQALRVADGTLGVQHPMSPDHLPSLFTSGRASTENMLNDDIRDRLRGVLESELVTAEGAARERLESALGEVSAQPTEYVWTWGFYGDPTTPFDPHLDLNGYTTTDPEGDPNLYNGESFPEQEMYQPGDHLGCSCEWVVLVGENVESSTTNALGPDSAFIPGGSMDTSQLAQDLRAEADSLG